MARGTPPAGDEEFGSGRGFDVLEVADARVVGVRAEAVLLVVDGAENVVTYCLNRSDGDETLDAEFNGVGSKVAGLQAVGEGHPDEVAEGEHEAEAIAYDVDGCEHGGLHVVAVEDVEGLGEGNEDDGVGNLAEVAVLLHDECKV